MFHCVVPLLHDPGGSLHTVVCVRCAHRAALFCFLGLPGLFPALLVGLLGGSLLLHRRSGSGGVGVGLSQLGLGGVLHSGVFLKLAVDQGFLVGLPPLLQSLALGQIPGLEAGQIFVDGIQLFDSKELLLLYVFDFLELIFLKMSGHMHGLLVIC